MSGVLAGAFGLASAMLLFVSLRRPSSNFAVAAGFALGLAVLAARLFLWTTPLLLAALFDRRYPASIRRVLAGSAVFGFALPLAGWALRRALGP